MPALECRHCGAPLPEDAASGPVACPYCHTVNEPTAALQRPKGLSADQQQEAFKEAIKEEIEERILQGRGARPQVTLPSATVRASPAKGCMASLRSCLTSCGCLVLLGGAAVVYGLVKDPGAVLRGFKQIAGGGLKPRDLRELTGHEPVKLDVPPPPEGFGAFDPGRDLPWLLEQAQGWAPDARLRHVRVVRARPDGSVDLAGDPQAEVEAGFDSPAALAKSLTLHARSYRDLNTGLQLRLAQGKVQARLEWGGARQPARPALAAAPLKTVLGALKAAHRLPASPLYNGELACDPRLGWIWSLQGLTTTEAIPRARAEDGSLIR